MKFIIKFLLYMWAIIISATCQVWINEGKRGAMHDRCGPGWPIAALNLLSRGIFPLRCGSRKVTQGDMLPWQNNKRPWIWTWDAMPSYLSTETETEIIYIPMDRSHNLSYNCYAPESKSGGSLKIWSDSSLWAIIQSFENMGHNLYQLIFPRSCRWYSLS